MVIGTSIEFYHNIFGYVIGLVVGCYRDNSMGSIYSVDTDYGVLSTAMENVIRFI